MKDLLNVSDFIHEEGFEGLKERLESECSVWGSIHFEYRLRNRLTQYEMAKKLDVDEKWIHRLEGGSIENGDWLFDRVRDQVGVTEDEIQNVRMWLQESMTE